MDIRWLKMNGDFTEHIKLEQRDQVTPRAGFTATGSRDFISDHETPRSQGYKPTAHVFTKWMNYESTTRIQYESKDAEGDAFRLEGTQNLTTPAPVRLAECTTRHNTHESYPRAQSEQKKIEAAGTPCWINPERPRSGQSTAMVRLDDNKRHAIGSNLQLEQKHSPSHRLLESRGEKHQRSSRESGIGANSSTVDPRSPNSGSKHASQFQPAAEIPLTQSPDATIPALTEMGHRRHGRTLGNRKAHWVDPTNG